MSDSIFQYIKVNYFKDSKKGGIVQFKKYRGTLYALRHTTPDYLPNIVTIGISMCHPNDTFNKYIGRELAMQEAFKQYSGNHYTKIDMSMNNYFMMNAIRNFIDRCEKYFKNCLVVYPKLQNSRIHGNIRKDFIPV